MFMAKESLSTPSSDHNPNSPVLGTDVIPGSCFSENIIHADAHCIEKLGGIDLICVTVLYCVCKSVLAWASLKTLQIVPYQRVTFL